MTGPRSTTPTVIAGRYELDGELGRGGMAEVRAGTDRRLRRPVAVKFLLPAMAAREDIRRRFESEARAAASLSHPHAVAVYDTGEHDGLPYIVMERLPGETLADRIAGGPVDPDWLVGMTGEVLGALGAAHAAGLVHRDVKPGNILLTADGHAKIADFGIAKSLEGPGIGLELTGTGQLLGTPAYLAPERLDGAPATPGSDLYALGVVMYEALTGVSPFAGDTPLATARAVAAGDWRPLASVRPGLDPSVVATVERAMSREPGRRFASASAMAAAMTGSRPGAVAAGEPTIVDGMVPRTGPATAVLDRRDLVAGPGPAAPPASAPPLPAPIARPRGRLPLAVFFGVVLLVLLIAGLNRGRSPGRTGAADASASTSTTAAPSPATALADQLRAEADRLSPADGAQAAAMATLLRQVADQVQAGSGGTSATGAIVSIGAWRLTGQISDAAAASGIAVLSKVPGVTVVTLQSLSPAPAPPNNAAPNKSKGKGKGGD